MFFPHWDILIVDDEPDVLAVTRLALQDVKVDGMPLRIHTATNKAEAIKLLESMKISGAPETTIAVAIVDVVMESESAGIELCEYIRNDLNNQYMQIFIRTGQPGIAPERAVIDRLDLTGYFTKVESTQQKLYTMVKTGIKQWFTYGYALGLLENTNQEILAAETSKGLLKFFKDGSNSFDDNDDGIYTGFFFEGQVIADHPDKVRALAAELEKIKPVYSTPEGHFLVSDGNRHMVRIKPTKKTADYYFVSNMAAELPRALYRITFENGLILSTLYKRGEGASVNAKAKPAKKASAKKPTKPVKKVVKKAVKKKPIAKKKSKK